MSEEQFQDTDSLDEAAPKPAFTGKDLEDRLNTAEIENDAASDNGYTVYDNEMHKIFPKNPIDQQPKESQDV